MYDNPEICSKCGGQCCKGLPGAAFPEDFGLPDGSLLRWALETGRWCIDWWEGDPRPGKDELHRAYFVRPATKGREGVWFDASWGGECTFLTASGCSLLSENRPLNCRMLEPMGEGARCKCHLGDSPKERAAIAWLPYHRIFEEMRP